MVKQKVKQMGLPMVIPRQMDSDLDLLKVMRTVKMMVRLRKMEIGLVKKMVMRMERYLRLVIGLAKMKEMRMDL